MGEMAEKNGAPRYSTLTQEMLDAFSALSYYSPLPGERELSEVFGVSRPTVRKALQILEDDRKVIRIQGKGSFYLGNPMYPDASTELEIGFDSQVVSHRRHTKSKVITQNVVPATADIAERLLLAEGEEIFHLERVLTFKEGFCSLANSYIPFKLCPALIHIDFTNHSLYASLRENGVRAHRVDQLLTTVPSREYQARHLGVQVDEPLSRRQTTAYDENDQVVEYADSHSPAYKTRYEISSCAPRGETDARNTGEDHQ